MQAVNLEDELNLKEIEKITRKYWEDVEIKKYIAEKYSNNETVAFVEGEIQQFVRSGFTDNPSQRISNQATFLTESLLK